MNALIGRRREQADLEEWCRSSKAELICIYGRRRVGKTYLVENTFRNNLAFSATGSEDKNLKAQLRVFHGALRRHGIEAKAAPDDWFDAFDRLRDLLESDTVIRNEDGRRVVFLDEFPWFATRRSAFLTAFADFWNSWASKQSDVAVIVCGSATSWIVKNLFENTGSMYNRITRRLYVAPFTLHETEQMAAALDLGWSRDTILQAYLVFGGLPYYIDMLDRRKSLAQNIDELCFGVHAPLRNEVPHLMEATLSGSPLHRKVLQELSRTKAGMHAAELAERLGIKGGSLSRTLYDLEKCGYIRKYSNPYEKYRASIYQLVDPFLLFSFKFMKDKPLVRWASFEGTPSYYAWRGNAFEMTCLGHVVQIKAAIGIAAVETTCFPWKSNSSNPGAQVDLVIERKDRVTDLCEMKYTDKPFVIDADCERSLLQKRAVFRDESRTRNAVHIVLVCANGLAAGTHGGVAVATVSTDDLFAF